MILSRHSKCLALVASAVVLVTTIVIVVYFFTLPRYRTTQCDINTFLQSKITVPDGWYLHNPHNTVLFLTKKNELPNISGTETYAYGEQISISGLFLEKPPEEWVAEYVPDDVLISSKRWGSILGHNILKVEHEVEYGGKSLTYYFFKEGRVYIFSLYPLETLDQASGKYVRNLNGVHTLDSVTSSFAASL
jgi:hypothetical protein